MIMLKSAIYSAFIIFFAASGFSQTHLIDSLKTQLSLETNDSLKGVILNNLSWELKSRNLDEAEKYCHVAIEHTTRSGQIKQRSSAYNTLGLVKQEQNEYDDALRYLKLSVKDKETVNDRKGLATVKNNIGVVYKNSGQMDLAITLFKEALQEHIAFNNLRGQSECLSNLGVVERTRGNLQVSSDYFFEALALKQKINDKIGVAIIYNNLSANAMDQSDFKKSIEYLYDAAKIFEELGQKVSLVSVYANIGRVNKELKNHKQAVAYCNKAIELGKSLGSEQNIIGAYASLGDLRFDEKNYTTSKKAYSEGIRLSNSKGNKFYLSHCYLGLGCCFLEQKKYEEAYKEIKRSIRLARELNQSKALARALQKLGKYFVDVNEPENAKDPLDESIKISKKNAFKDILALCYLTKSKINSSDQQEYLLKAKKINDSIFTKDLASKFAEMQTKYETDKKEQNIRILRQRKELSSLRIKRQDEKLSYQRMWLFGAGIGMLLLTISGFYMFKNQHLKARMEAEALRIKTEEEERSRIAKDLHDELGSGLSKIMFLTEIAHNSGKDSERLNSTLSTVSETSRSLIENMRDLIWAMNPENTTLSNLIARIREYSHDYLEEFPIDLQVIVSDEIPDMYISNQGNRNIYMLVKEALQNIVKHANSTEVKLLILIDKDLKIRIIDNGKGFVTDTSNSGNGLKNLKSRAEALGGMLIVRSEPKKGSEVQFEIDLKKLKRQ